jgi:hypothetical protein
MRPTASVMTVTGRLKAQEMGLNIEAALYNHALFRKILINNSLSDKSVACMMKNGLTFGKISGYAELTKKASTQSRG